MAQDRRRYVVDELGRRESVVLSLRDYEELMEDIRDLAVIAERKDEPTQSFDELKDRLELKWRSTGSK